MKFILLIITSAILLNGCASYQPIPESYAGSTTPIYDSAETVSPTKVYFFQLTTVNGRNVSTSSGETYEASYGRGFSMNPVSAYRQIPAEKSILKIEGITYYAAPILDLLGESFSVEGEVELDVLETNSYYVKGELSKEYSAVWIEDNNGNIVTKKIEKSSP